MRSSRPYILLAIIIALWGINFIIARLLSGFDPIHVSGILYGFFRYVLGAMTMIFVLGAQRRSLHEMRNHIAPYARILLISAFFSAIFVISTHMSAEFISSGTTSIIVNLCPIVVLIFGVIYLGESLSVKKVAGFILGLVAGFLFLWNTLNSSSGVEFGVTLAIIGMLSWAAYTITLHYLEGADRYIVMTIKHVSSSFMILPFILLFVIEGGTLIFILDIWTILGLFFGGVLASGLAYVLYFTAIEVIGAPKASSFLFLVPFVSLIGDFVLGEPPYLLALIAGIVAIIGVALVRLSDLTPRENNP
ncbi:MAG: DMT family transporter [Candidatus Thorarchaeota archaeon]